MTETLFYNTFDKFPSFSGPFPYSVPLDQTSVVGDHMVVNLIQKGDYISSLYLELGTNSLEKLEYFEVLISKTLVYRFTGEIIHILRQLRTPRQKKPLFDSRIQIPINPFPALGEVQFRLKVNSAQVQESNMSITADFIYTGKPTDGMFFIEQIQQVNTLTDLRLRNCVKELFIIVQNQSQRGTFNYSNVSGGHNTTDLALQLNQETKYKEGPVYFSTVQQLAKHTSTLDYVYVMPFCLNPEDPSPTGTLNMSMVQRQRLDVTFSDSDPKDVRVYALSYNILNVKNNLGTLLFVL